MLPPPKVSYLVSVNMIRKPAKQQGLGSRLVPLQYTYVEEFVLGYAVTQLVEALRYKSEGRGFDSRCCHWNFSSFRSHCGPGVDSVFNRNEYQEYFLGGKGGRCVGLTTLAPTCVDCLEMWEPQPPGTLRACPGL